MNDHYLTHSLMLWAATLTDGEFDRRLWTADPDLDCDARDERDWELLLDLTGNLDAFACRAVEPVEPCA